MPDPQATRRTTALLARSRDQRSLNESMTATGQRHTSPNQTGATRPYNGGAHDNSFNRTACNATPSMMSLSVFGGNGTAVLLLTQSEWK